MRHRLNDGLRLHGGHVGYYTRTDSRGRGYGKQALGLALMELRELGICRALVTVNPGNPVSIRVVEANGGEFTDVATEPLHGTEINRYWVDLTKP